MCASQDEIPPPPAPPPSSSQTPTQQTPHTVSTIKLHILKKGEYDIWAMKMEHYLAYTDYPIWEVIQNGNGPVSITTDTSGQIKVLPPRTAEEIVARERERKARTTLLMALPEDHLAKFHKMTDAKEIVSVVSVLVTTAGVAISTTEPRTPPTIAVIIFGDDDLTIAQTLVKMRSKKAKEKKKGVALRDEEEPPRLNISTTTVQPLPTIDLKDKGKGVLVKEEPEKLVKVKKSDQGLAQIESDAELAQRLHEEELAELDRAQQERQRQEEATNAALAEEFDEIQARIDIDHELAIRLTHEEQEK
ncbi:hypothetical protein Tco_1049357 [Tanacetum coccineum]